MDRTVMKPCKRLEIVIEKPLARLLARSLDEAGARGYTMIDHAARRGDRGERRGDELMGTGSNCVFIVACDTEEEAGAIVEAVRPHLSRSGGMCLVSDATWVKH